MSYSTYQPNDLKRNFGAILLILGITPLAAGIIRFLVVFIGFTGLITTAIENITILIILILLIVNNKKLKVQLNTIEFNSYFIMITVAGIITISALLLYWIGWFFFWGSTWVITLIAYDVILILAQVFFIVAWVQMRKYANTLSTPYRINLASGAAFLIVGPILITISLLIDIFGVFLVTDYDMLLMVVLVLGIINLVGNVLALIGYIKVSNATRIMSLRSDVTEPVIGGPQPIYGAPQSYIPPKSQAGANEIRFCMKCGSHLAIDGTFCPKCGWKVEHL